MHFLLNMMFTFLNLVSGDYWCICVCQWKEFAALVPHSQRQLLLSINTTYYCYHQLALHSLLMQVAIYPTFGWQAIIHSDLQIDRWTGITYPCSTRPFMLDLTLNRLRQGRVLRLGKIRFGTQVPAVVFKSHARTLPIVHSIEDLDIPCEFWGYT